MTTEKIMENLLIIAENLNTEDRKIFDYVRKNNLNKSTFSGVGAKLGEFYITLESQYRAEIARKLGKSSVKHGMESILKSAKGFNKQFLQYAYYDEDFQIACDGYMIAALSKNNHVPLAERPDNDAYKWNFPNWKNKIPWNCDTENRIVELPDLTALKLYLKSEKSKSSKKNPFPIIFDFGASLPYIKIEYLITAMEILPDAKAYYAGDKNCCLMLKDDNGSVVYVMGIEAASNMERIRTKL